MNETEIHGLWVTEWVIIKEQRFYALYIDVSIDDTV